MNIPAGIDPADIMQSDVMDCLPEYKCPFCGAKMFFLRDDDAECQDCGKVFGVEIVIKNESTWSFRFWQNGEVINRSCADCLNCQSNKIGWSYCKTPTAKRFNGRKGWISPTNPTCENFTAPNTASTGQWDSPVAGNYPG
jgi:DNA-directed RNA polymerase subunit RPC12/RpoP